MREEKLQLTPQKYKYANKRDNLQRIDKFLDMCSLPLTQEERENTDRPMTGNEIESIIKNSQQTKVQDQMTSQVNTMKYLMKLSLILLKLVQKN